MKKIILSLAIALSGYSVYAQTFNPTSSINAAGAANSFKGGYTFAYATSGSPWNGAFMSFGGFAANNYDCQFSTDYGPNGGSHISFRTDNGDASTWNSWNELWHSGNLNNANTDFTAKNIHVKGGVDVQSSDNLNNYLTVSNNTISTSFGAGGTSWGLIGTTSNHDFAIYTNNSEKLRVTASGNLGIGTMHPDQMLTVNGIIHAKEVKVDTSIPVPDYVFEDTYKLPDLTALKNYLDANHHLPEIPSAAEVEKNGLNLSEMNLKLLKKVEELTLYVIAADKKNEDQLAVQKQQQTLLLQMQQELKTAQQTIDDLKTQVSALNKSK